MREQGELSASGGGGPDDTWDAVVIGAGPAGSVCAHALARIGKRVLLVEKAVMPRAKVCGCCIAPGGAAALEEAGLGGVLDGAARIDECEVRASGRSMSLPARGFRVLGRDVLDSRLAAAAQAAGATLLTGRGASVDADGTVRVRTSGERAGTAGRARMIVAADGVGGGSLSERPEFAWRVSTRSRMGLGATLVRSPVPLVPGRMAMLCGRDGYLGLVRLPTGEIDAAAALDPGAVRNAGGPAGLCARIVTAAGGDPSALVGAAWRGTPMLTRRRARVEAGNIFVVGDAAGYVEPFTGEGMTWAIHGSLVLARIIGARLEGRSVPGAWARAHQREIASHHRRCGIVARLVRNEGLLRAAVALGTFVPRAMDWAVGVLGQASAARPACPTMRDRRPA